MVRIFIGAAVSWWHHLEGKSSDVNIGKWVKISQALFIYYKVPIIYLVVLALSIILTDIHYSRVVQSRDFEILLFFWKAFISQDSSVKENVILLSWNAHKKQYKLLILTADHYFEYWVDVITSKRDQWSLHIFSTSMKSWNFYNWWYFTNCHITDLSFGTQIVLF